MASGSTYTCRLDSQSGGLPHGEQPGFIYRVKTGDTVQFQLDAASPLNTSSTTLVIDLEKYEGVNEPLHLRGSHTPLKHWFVEVLFPRAGTYKLVLEFVDPSSREMRSSQGDFIIVEPALMIAGREYPLESLVMQSVLSRCLGPYTRWEEVLTRQRDLGYQVFHFTPIQELGVSQSLYSLGDQLKLNPALFPGLLTDREQMEALETTISGLEGEGIACVVDIVLNHMSIGSRFVEDYPQVTYNLENCPYLRAAYVLDSALEEFSNEMACDRIQNYKHGHIIDCERDLTNIMQVIKLELLPRLTLQKYFSMDQEKVVKEFRAAELLPFSEEVPAAWVEFYKAQGLEAFIKQFALLGEGEGILSVTINHGKIWATAKKAGVFPSTLVKEIPAVLKSICSGLLNRFEKHLGEIIKNIEGDIRYNKLEKRETIVDAAHPLIKKYFQRLPDGNAALCNGFIFENKDVTKDMAAKGDWNFFRRKVVIWSDSLKLRYGTKYEDCPPLWSRMEEYVLAMARVFKGFRLDNAHGTPLEVSEYLLTQARKVNPNLLVIAELFTGDWQLDAMYVARLGINLLVREAMQVRTPRDLSGMVYGYGNGETKSVGCIEPTPEHGQSLLRSHYDNPPLVLVPAATPAIFYDFTHDNETPAQKRTAMDALPTAAIVSLTNCAMASTRGFDQLIPAQLSVISENRLYPVDTEAPEELQPYQVIPGECSLTLKTLIEYVLDSPAGINTIQVKGSWDNWQRPIDLMKVTDTHFSVLVLFPDECKGKEYQYKFILNGSKWVTSATYPIYREGRNENNLLRITSQLTTVVPAGLYKTLEVSRSYLNSLHQKLALEGYSELFVSMESEDVMVIVRQNPQTMESYFMVARSWFKPQTGAESLRGIKLPGVVERVEFIAQLSIRDWAFIEDKREVNGLKGALEVFGSLGKFATINYLPNERVDNITFHSIPAAFVCVIKTRLSSEAACALSQLRECYSIIENESETRRITAELNLAQVNYVLWKCDSEELDWSDGRRNVYDVPGFGKFMYAGLGSLAIEFKRMGVFNQLGHAIFNNIRDGDWLINYHCVRLTTDYLPDVFTAFCLGALSNIKQLPRGSIPKHIVKFTLGLFRMLKLHVLRELYQDGHELMASEDTFVETLAFATTQFYGDVKSAKTPLMKDTLAAGLPHFSVGFMRCWGRDTFIAFKGVFLRTGRYAEAADILATYASTMQHGLIPNLLDGAKKCRYNARDATWWFLQAAKDYIQIVPQGNQILARTVDMQFLKGEHAQMTIGEIIQCILQAHAVGITFREWNAGPQIDAHMKSAGFDILIRLDPATGFIYGGNQWNCGTWMDKMGSSEKARNRGVPATPRDGADIEITALCFSVVSFLASANDAGVYPYREVKLHDGEKLTLAEWAQRIQYNFEPYYWIPEIDHSPHVNQRLARSRGIYKDVVGSASQEGDYMFRPNQCVAMAVAPELFSREHALIALDNIDTSLLTEILTNEQIGVRTLSEEWPQYRTLYNNADDSEDGSIAQGFSYHNGPEWVWPLGYVLVAKLHFQQCSASHIMRVVANARKHINESRWLSLPELTNRNGGFCPFSAPAQAWSVATVLDALLETPKLAYDEF